jgi:sulfatase modifying factor 1
LKANFSSFTVRILLSEALLILVASSCSSCSEGDSTHESSDTGDINSDTDSDSDSDSDSDGDSDTNTNTDSDTEFQTEDCEHPEVVKNCTDGWCTIPPGCFVLGSPENEPCRAPYENKQVQVTLTQPFIIKKTEVTRSEWIAAGFPDPSYKSDYLSAPVNMVNWFEALAYCNALSEAEGLETCYDLSSCVGQIGTGCPDPEAPQGECAQFEGLFKCESRVRKFDRMYDCPGYRLPTAAEWEYSARAGTTTATYIGDLSTDSTSGCVSDQAVDSIGWHCGLTDHSMPVTMKNPNGWGLYDILGNVLEWIDYVYTGLGLEYGEGEDGPLMDPIGSIENEELRRGSMGGSFLTEPCNVKSSRDQAKFNWQRQFHFGFRPVRTITNATDQTDAGVN